MHRIVPTSREPKHTMSQSIALASGGLADLDTVYPLLRRDFPPAEVIDRAQLARLLAGERYKLYLAHARPAGELVGYALTFEPPSPPLAWLDYLAVDAPARGHGHGAALVDALCARLAREGRLGLLLEVEPPTSDDPRIRRDQERRVAFYRRIGARPLAVDYIYPTAGGGFPMLLFFRPIAPLNRLPAAMLRDMIAAVYDGIHDDVPGRDALLATFLDRVQDQPL